MNSATETCYTGLRDKLLYWPIHNHHTHISLSPRTWHIRGLKKESSIFPGSQPHTLGAKRASTPPYFTVQLKFTFIRQYRDTWETSHHSNNGKEDQIFRAMKSSRNKMEETRQALYTHTRLLLTFSSIDFRHESDQSWTVSHTRMWRNTCCSLFALFTNFSKHFDRFNFTFRTLR